ncbi:MAG: HAD family phosphatase [Chthoniobacterales bacterium]
MAIDAVIFDIGNVLLKFDYYIAANKLLQKNQKSDYPAREAITTLVLDYESGRIDRATFIKSVRETFGDEGQDEEFLRIWENIFEPNDPMVALLPHFKKRSRLFLLSNIGCIHQEFIFQQYPFFSHFQDGIYSYRAKHLKPAPEIFRLAQQTFSVVPEQTLYVDDREENVQEAANQGFIALHYDYNRHADFEQELRIRKIHPCSPE